MQNERAAAALFCVPTKGRENEAAFIIYQNLQHTFYILYSRLNKENWPYLTGHKNAMQTAVLIPPKWPLKGTLKSPPPIFPPSSFLTSNSNEVLSFLSFFPFLLKSKMAT